MKKCFFVTSLLLMCVVILSACSQPASAPVEVDSAEGVSVEEAMQNSGSPVDFSKIKFSVDEGVTDYGIPILQCTITNNTGIDFDDIALYWIEKKNLSKEDKELWIKSAKEIIEGASVEYDLTDESVKKEYEETMNFIDNSSAMAHVWMWGLDSGTSELEGVCYYGGGYYISKYVNKDLDLMELYEMLEPYYIEVSYDDENGESHDLKYMFKTGAVVTE